MPNNVVLVSGANTCAGTLAARTLADHGEVVYAGMDAIAGRNRDSARGLRDYADREKVELRPLELDAASEQSVTSAVAEILAREGRIDVLVLGACPTDLGAQRLHRAVMAALDPQREGLVVWLSSPDAVSAPDDADALDRAANLAAEIARVVGLPRDRRPSGLVVGSGHGRPA